MAAAPISVAALALGGLAGADLLTRASQLSLSKKQQELQARVRSDQVRAEFEEEERRRARALALANATAQARLGASGGGSAGGSGEALLAGLVDESEADTLEAFARRQRQLRDIRAGLALDRRRSLLDQSRFVLDNIPFSPDDLAR